jgi:serine/threonine-protein kinase HipA
VRLEGEAICLPLGGAPSTHILKPNIERFAGVVLNEAFCMRLAAAAGLTAAPVEVREAAGIDYLLVERYDRHYRPAPDGAPAIERLHREDFCQALGIVSEQKYQKEGGPALKPCFALLPGGFERARARHRAAARLRGVQLHHRQQRRARKELLANLPARRQLETRLSPLYDVVSTILYPELSRDMAMRIGEVYSSEQVTLRQFERPAGDAGLGKPLVRARLAETTERIGDALRTVPVTNPVAENVANLIRSRSERALGESFGAAEGRRPPPHAAPAQHAPESILMGAARKRVRGGLI